MNLNLLYESYIYQPENYEKHALFEKFWGKIPKKFNQIEKSIVKQGIQSRVSEKSNIEEQEALYKVILDFHKKNKFMTPQINDLLDNWFDSIGSVECGHQPIYLGGSSFLFNKLTFSSYLSSNSLTNLKMSPIFFIGDHDEIQNELTISRLPQAYSQTGLELKSDYDDKYVLTPMHKLPKPEKNLLIDHINKIKSNYRELFKFSKIKPENRPLLEARMEEIIGIIYESYFKSENTISDWITQLIGDILIYKNKIPLLMAKGSDKGLKKLILPYLENLLSEDNRTNLISILNEYNGLIGNSGYKAGLSLRGDDYVPFFLECPKDLTRDRVRLSTDGSTLNGVCPKCKEEYDISYNNKKPDLNDYYEFLSPRVDSRSISVNQLLKTRIRVTGGGETNYYAQIMPYIRKAKINPVPLIIKHPRVYYNTPWGEKKAEEIKKIDTNIKTLHEKENFIRMGKISKSKDENELRNLINETKFLFNDTFKEIEIRIIDIEKNEAFAKNRKLKMIHQTLKQYLSLMWGHYTSNKSIQEVSWLWVDLGIVTGLRDLTGFYNRSLKLEMPISPTLWLSSGKFN